MRSLAGVLLLVFCGYAGQDRILGPIDDSQTTLLSRSVPRSARAEFDRGPADPNLSISYAGPVRGQRGPSRAGDINNGQIASFLFTVAAAAPGTVTDSLGNLVPLPAARAGDTITLFMTGDRDERPLLTTGAPASGSEKPILPVSVTVAGAAATITYVGSMAGSAGVTQVNFTIPASAPAGPQPVVVTVGGAVSQAATVTIGQ